MGTQGTATLDFGAFPGQSDVSLVITGIPDIQTTSLVEAWILPATTTDHSQQEHRVETLGVMAGQIVAGTGFTIFLFNVGSNDTMIYGQWNVAWVWN